MQILHKPKNIVNNYCMNNKIKSKNTCEGIKDKLICKEQRDDKSTSFCDDFMFSNFEFCNLDIKNHFYYENLSNIDCRLVSGPEKLENFYTNIVSSGVGMVFTGAYFDRKFGFNGEKYSVFCVENTTEVKKFKEFTSKIHSYGTKIFLTIKPFAGRSVKKRNKNWVNYSASFNKYYYDSNMTCMRITDGKCREIIEVYSDIAEFSKKAGFDGIMIDATVSSVFGEMSNQNFNRRVFGYFSDTSEILLASIKKCKEKVGDFPIILKTSPYICISEIFGEQSKNIVTLHEVAKLKKPFSLESFLVETVKYGIDGFIFNFGTKENEYLTNFLPYEETNLFLDFYKSVKMIIDKFKLKNKFGQDVGLFLHDNVLWNNKLHKMLSSGTVISVDITREILANKNYLTNQKMQKTSISCVKCGICDDLSDNFAKVECLVNPFLNGLNLRKVENSNLKPIAVVGAGLAGMYASYILTKRGYSVDLFEENKALNLTGKSCCVFNFDKEIAGFYTILEQILQENAKNNKMHIYLNKRFIAKKSLYNNYSCVVIATGFHERFLNVRGAILKNVKSIYEVLKDESIFEEHNSIIIYAKSELSIKLAMYLAKNKKKVGIIFQDLNVFKNLPNSKITYYVFALSKLRVKVYYEARPKRIEEDCVEIILNQKTLNIDSMVLLLNALSGQTYPYLDIAKEIDCDLFVYEPEIYSNNRLYYDLVKDGFSGELYMIGNALETGTMLDDIKSAFFVANNI